LLEAEEEEENLMKKESFMRYPRPHNSNSFFNPEKRKKKEKPLDDSLRRLFAEKSFAEEKAGREIIKTLVWAWSATHS
jgi:hypothetical protein